jgi:glycosyltransferase involved in cell wall biosynthesis
METQVQRYLKRATRWQEGIVPIHAPTYVPDQIVANKNRTHWWGEFTRLREAHDLVVISPVRHVWTQPGSINYKGTDKLIRAWAAFRTANPQVKAVLVTLEYGADVEASKRLIESLGINSSVAWLPKMYRKDLMVGLNLADIVCGYFGESWITGGVLTEAMVARKPILGWRDDSLHTDFAPGYYPMMIAREPKDIVQRLEEYVADPDRHVAMGAQAAAWYDREIVGRALQHYSDYLSVRDHRVPDSSVGQR